MKAIHYMRTGDDASADEIFISVCSSEDLSVIQAEYLDASIALKLAMNLFDMGQDDTSNQNNT